MTPSLPTATGIAGGLVADTEEIGEPFDPEAGSPASGPGNIVVGTPIGDPDALLRGLLAEGTGFVGMLEPWFSPRFCEGAEEFGFFSLPAFSRPFTTAKKSTESTLSLVAPNIPPQWSR